MKGKGMNNTNNDAGFPVDGGANEKLAYLTSKITPVGLIQSAAQENGEPVWRLDKNGRFSISGARVRPERRQGCFRVLAKSLAGRTRKLLSLLP